MNKKLQDLFNLPTQTDDTEEDTVEYVQLEDLDMQEMLDQVDKIDAALPQLPGRDSFDAEFDDYASNSIEKLDLEVSKHELHKAIHKPDENETKVIEGSVFGSRADVIKAIAAATKKDSK
jgi:hypothetical protein